MKKKMIQIKPKQGPLSNLYGVIVGENKYFPVVYIYGVGTMNIWVGKIR